MMITACTLGFRNICDHGFGGKQQTSYANTILQCTSCHFDWVDNACFTHIAIDAFICIKAKVLFFGFVDVVNNNRAIKACVFSNHLAGHFHYGAQKIQANRFYFAIELKVVKAFACLKKGNTTARNNAFCKCSPGSMQCIFVKSLAFFHFGFGCSANFKLSHTACKLCKSFLKLFTIIITVSLGDFLADHFAATFNGFLIASTFSDGGVFSIDFNFLGSSKIRKFDLFKRNA